MTMESLLDETNTIFHQLSVKQLRSHALYQRRYNSICDESTPIFHSIAAFNNVIIPHNTDPACNIEILNSNETCSIQCTSVKYDKRLSCDMNAARSSRSNETGQESPQTKPGYDDEISISKSNEVMNTISGKSRVKSIMVNSNESSDKVPRKGSNITKSPGRSRSLSVGDDVSKDKLSQVKKKLGESSMVVKTNLGKGGVVSKPGQRLFIRPPKRNTEVSSSIKIS